MGRPPKALAQERIEGKLDDSQYKAMEDILEVIRNKKDAQERSMAEPFEQLVPKRDYPDYYRLIKNPMALAIIEKKVKLKQYDEFTKFVEDCALVFHNCRRYNKTGSDLYDYAVEFEALLAQHLLKLKAAGIIDEQAATFPDLGPIPSDPENSEEESGAEEPDDDDADEEEDDDDDDDEEETKKRRNRRQSRTSVARPDSSATVGVQSTQPTAGSDGLNQQALDPRRKRGRPPRVDNPMEMRIKNVLKGIRRVKDENNVSKIKGFDKLPDQKQHPGYYSRITTPICVEGIKKKIKRREYEVLNDFINDLRLMFQNTRQYYDQNHVLYKDSLILEDEAAKLAQTEMAKSEIQLGEEMFSAAGDRNVKDKRFPVSKIEHKGESYSVGDWIHLINPNDPAKPTVGQIFRTWRTENGSYWINACWYYRPGQTVHSVYRKFFDREVFKTGQYRDHQIEEVLGKCFVMFVTKYSRGRPKGFANKPVYVCESRYNELEKKLNKIKTWKSCIPDEIRSRDYEMDMFPQPQQLIKVESPIKHLLPKDAKEGDPLPEATMGAENAPPIVGAVFLGEKEETPPPEITPPPPPPVHHTPRPSRPSRAQSGATDNYEGLSMTQMYKQAASAANVPNHHTPMDTPRGSAMGTPSGLPPQTPLMNHHHQPSPSPYPTVRPYSTAPHQYQMHHSQSPAPIPPTGPIVPGPQAYIPPNPDGTAFIIPDVAQKVPPEIAQYFQRDAEGNILFYRTPPIDVNKPVANAPGRNGQIVGHSLAYLAKKKELDENRKRKEKELEERQEESKRKKSELDEQLKKEAQKAMFSALEVWVKQLEN